MLCNSYIFWAENTDCSNINTSDKADSKFVLVLPESFTSIVRRTLSIQEDFCDIALFTSRVSFKTDDIEFELTIKSVSATPAKYYINISAKNEDGNILKCAESLNSICARLCNQLEKKYEYNKIITYDAVSEHYCSLAQPLLGRYERLLRKLLFNVFVLYLGTDYYKKWCQNTSQKDNENPEKVLYSLNMSDYEHILFDKYWSKLDEHEVSKLLSNCNNLSSLSDKELRTIIQNIQPKSNWDRFFSHCLSYKGLAEDIKEIRHLRNDVYHNKILNKKNYNRLVHLLESVCSKIEAAITIIESNDINTKNFEKLQSAFKGLFESVENTKETIITNFTKILTHISDSIQLIE